MQPHADVPHIQRGKAVHIESVKPVLKAPRTKRLKLKWDKLLSNVAFNFNLRCYSAEPGVDLLSVASLRDMLKAGSYTRPLLTST